MTAVRPVADEYGLESYRLLLELAQRHGYRFASFLEVPDASCKSIYLRHDIDFSVTAAVELARVNASLGIQATFFVLLRSEIYNVLSPWALARVRELAALGQHVGLHYSPPTSLDRGQLSQAVRDDFAILQAAVPSLSPVFSWHNPGDDIVGGAMAVEIPGLVNVYGARLVQEIRYRSDSNMRHSVAEFRGLLKSVERSSLQLLLHPINWVVGGKSVLEILAGAWKYVLRDREHGMRTNSVYSAVFPAGMSEAMLQDFAGHWLDEALIRRPRRDT